MQARININVECPKCTQIMSRLPHNYYVQCLTPDCVQFQMLYELPTLTLNKVGESVEIDESKLVEVIPDAVQ